MSGSSLTDRLKFMFYLASKEVEKDGRKILHPEDIVRIMSSERTSDSGRILATYKIVTGDIDRYLAIYPPPRRFRSLRFSYRLI